ncbi:hypothetical protein PFISCL1PPCAC_3362, partial [Pristionchus fissidentatus]
RLLFVFSIESPYEGEGVGMGAVGGNSQKVHGPQKGAEPRGGRSFISGRSLCCGLLQLDELLDTIVHLLDGLVLGQAQASLVRDIVDTAGRVRVLSVDAANLQLELVAHRLEVLLGRDLGQLDVHGGAHGSTEVGGAEGEVAKTLVSGEGRLLLDGLNPLDEAGEHRSDIASILHGDDAE